MAGIFQDNTFYPFGELINYNGASAELTFCRDWLNNQQEFVIKSSGSTGAPKEIILERHRMQWSAKATRQSLPVSENEHLLLCLDIKGVGGLMMLVRAMEWNCDLTIVGPASDPLEQIEEEHPFTMISLVPFQLASIFKNAESKAKLVRFKTVLIGGAPLDLILEEKLQNLPSHFYHSYGMSETCSHIALRLLNGAEKSKSYKPLKGVKISLSPDSCLVIESPSAISGKVITNDLAEIFEDGSFVLKGRLDFAINSGGIKIIPEEVEELVSQYMLAKNLHKRFFCYGIKDPLLGQKLVLFIEGEEMPGLQEELFLFLKNKGEKYKVPKHLIFAPAFRETPTGKIDRPSSAKEFYGEE